MQRKRTKIVCTIGPSSQAISRLTMLMKSGMNAARLNLSHATHADHKRLIKHVRQAEKKTGSWVPIIADLQGPKIRLGSLPKEGVEVKTGEMMQFDTSFKEYKNGVFPVTLKNLHSQVKKKERILIDDGLVEVEVQGVSKTRIKTKVINGGMLSSHKGMNFPDTKLKVSALTKKDKEDAVFALSQGVEWMALSFVKNASDVRMLKKIIDTHTPKGEKKPRIIVKIEKHEAIVNFKEILEEADGVMIARGDLGIEIPAEEVPVRQKELIQACRVAGKPVIVATQMLDSMIRNPRPTRAEVSDVANAVFDHTDAVMLSGESATGKYPVEAVRIMTKIIDEAEQSPYDDVPIVNSENLSPPLAVSNAVKLLAMRGQLNGIVKIGRAHV